MTDLNIILQGNGHLYEQIYEYIRNEIRKGKLLCGERLPSTRSLADFLTISRTTVEMAYDQLLSEGYIESKPHRGYYVCETGDLFEMNYPRVTNREMGNQEAVTETGFWEKENPEIDFSPRTIDMSRFPYATWKKINRGILVDAKSSMFSSGAPQGDRTFRETIARYLQLARGVNCNADQIIIGAGNDYLLMLLEQIIGYRKIAMEQVTYTRAADIFRHFGYAIRVIGMDENGMLASELDETDADLAYVMPSHQYPAGTVMSIARRMELLQWAAKGENRYLIEDDYDSEFRYRGKPVPSLQASDHLGKVIYIGTFSKSIAPAIRVSYMVLPQQLIDVYHKTCSFFSSTVSRINQEIINEFIRDGYFERYMNKMRRIYRMKHDYMLRELDDFACAFDISGADAGLHLLLSCKDGRTEQDLLMSAAKQKVRVYALTDYALEDGIIHAMPPVLRRPTVILGYASLTVAELEKGIRILRAAWLS